MASGMFVGFQLIGRSRAFSKLWRKRLHVCAKG